MVKTRILAVRAILGFRNLGVLDDLIEHVLADRGLLRLAAFFQCLVDVLRQIVGRLLAELGNGLSDFGCLDSTHNKNPLLCYE